MEIPTTPWMHDSEILLILKHLYYTDTMLEWGSGGSTLYFPNFVKNYYSIEHDPEWFEGVKGKVGKDVSMNLVPWDFPRTLPTQKHQFKTYIEHVSKLGVEKFDKVLVDGRARGWCAEYVLKHLHKNSLIFIHDFWQRPQYHIVFDWYEEVASIKNPGLQTLVVLKPKEQYVN